MTTASVEDVNITAADSAGTGTELELTVHCVAYCMTILRYVCRKLK